MEFISLANRTKDKKLREVFSISMYQPNEPEKIEEALQNSQNLYGMIDNGQIIGVIAFSINNNKLVITNIATDPARQRQGIGRAMIGILNEKYKLLVEAETDDEAVGFYQKCGFRTTEFIRHNTRRWLCQINHRD